jgi:solute carrier family 25 phosphate transporter 3
LSSSSSLPLSSSSPLPLPLLTKRSCSFALAGALGCAVTHGALTPVDVVKTRIQLEPEVYNKVGTQP